MVDANGGYLERMTVKLGPQLVDCSCEDSTLVWGVAEGLFVNICWLILCMLCGIQPPPCCDIQVFLRL